MGVECCHARRCACCPYVLRTCSDSPWSLVALSTGTCWGSLYHQSCHRSHHRAPPLEDAMSGARLRQSLAHMFLVMVMQKSEAEVSFTRVSYFCGSITNPLVRNEKLAGQHLLCQQSAQDKNEQLAQKLPTQWPVAMSRAWLRQPVHCSRRGWVCLSASTQR